MDAMFKRIALLGTVGLALSACSDDDSDVIPEALVREAVANYADIVHASYSDSLSGAEALAEANEALIASPSTDTLTDARQAWLDSREPYLQTEVYRFYEGPIDNAEDGPEGLINAWPLDENYIDYVEDDDSTGIINDDSVTIDKAALEALNEDGGEKNIATGFHAIEFLLWGQDLDVDGPGARPHTDYIEGSGGTASNQARRGQYLSTASELLVDHLQGLVADWAPDDSANYRAELIAAEPDDGLRRILTGMIVLSGFETGGERLQAALDAGDQEEEHSCFSDNTHRDMIQDIQGVQNVYLGSYGDIEGTGIREVIAARDEELAAAIETKIAESLSKANALEPPFDQEIHPDNAEGRARVTELIVSLQELEALLQDAFRLFELDIPDDPV